MRLQFRFLIVLMLLFIAAAATLFTLRNIEISRSHKVLQSELKQRKAYVNHIVEVDGRALHTFVVDESYWDDLVNFVKSGDLGFAKQNLDTGLSDFGLDGGIWVYRPNNSLVYASSTDSALNTKGLILPTAFFDKLKTDKFEHFYEEVGDNLVEIRAATIVPTLDSQHATPAQGFLLTGSLINKTYLDDVSNLSQSNMQLLPATANSSEFITNKSVSFANVLKSWDGVTVGVLRSSSDVQVISDLDRTYNREIILLIVFTFLISAIVATAVWRFVLKPVEQISASVKNKNPQLIANLSHHKNEFGRLAQTITEFFQQKIIIQEAAIKEAQLENLNREKATFLAVAAHELNGPVNNVRIFAEYLSYMIQKQAKTADLVKFIQRIGHQSSKLNILINDLRAASEGKRIIDFQKRYFDFDSFLQEEIEQARFATKQRLDFSGSTAVTVNSDPDRLGQVVSNLIRNASKYSPATGSINIRSSVENNQVVVEVEDFGLGISPADQDKIFQPFYRSPSIEKSYPGLGLGLSISSQIVEQLGGRMWVNSELGKGSRFFFSVPILSHPKPASNSH